MFPSIATALNKPMPRSILACTLLAIAFGLQAAPVDAQSIRADKLASAGCSADPNDPQMIVTDPLLPSPGDEVKVRALGERVREAILPYRDIEEARRDGYKGFGDDPGRGIVHYVNTWRSWREGRRLNPEKPGALLYLRTDSADGPSYELVGAMFTAKDNATVDELNSRVPLSQAR